MGNAGVGKPGGKYGGDGGEGSGADGSGGVCISAVVYVGGLHPSECMQGLQPRGETLSAEKDGRAFTAVSRDCQVQVLIPGRMSARQFPAFGLLLTKEINPQKGQAAGRKRDVDK